MKKNPVLLLLLLPTVLGVSCVMTQEKTADFEKEKKFTLYFEKMMFFQPTMEFFKIAVDMDNKCFSRPKPITLNQSDLLVGSNKEYEQALNLLRNQGDIYVPIDISPTAKWFSFRKLMSPETEKKTRSYEELFLVNPDEKIWYPIRDCAGNLYFSSDGHTVYLNKDWKLCTYDLLSKEVMDLYAATTFFQTVDRKRIFYFYDHKINVLEFSSGMVREIGTYKYIAYDSGFINDRFAYFITAVSNKGGPKYLYVLDMNTSEITKCPFALEEARVLMSTTGGRSDLDLRK